VDYSGEGEQETHIHALPLGGLSTTLSSIGLAEKSMVEFAVAAEQRKFLVLRMINCP